ncbi:DUF262 domain-containing protein [Streptomyces sp. NPDC051217]|uniref:DUF262 domain-containing protein n=1 Tax=Streptomyces sp. NPDC051217 TaxID=3365644 RepID=UPI0037AE802C
MAKIKQAARQTLGQLIGANNPPIVVPDYSQRQYSWTRKEVSTYWDDVQKFKNNWDSDDENSAEYFIGPIVTITDDKVSKRHLLDGQQRLTTSTILVAALRDALWNIGSDESKTMANHIQRDWISRKTGRRTPPEYFITLSQFDLNFFRDYVQAWDEVHGRPDPAEISSKFSHDLIKGAYGFFAIKIADHLADIPGDMQKLDWIDDLRVCLISGLVFVEIQTPSTSDANEVFETINSRGRDLSTPDLVRNFLMEKSRNADEKARVNSAWEVLLTGFDRREDIEKFLRHYWVARHGDVKSHSLYTTIRSTLAERFEDSGYSFNVTEFSADLETCAERYQDLISAGTGEEDFDLTLNDIRRLGADAIYPLLLALSGKNDYSFLSEVSTACLSYYVRWTVIGKKESTLLEENLFKLAKEVSGGLELQLAVTQVRTLIPDDATFLADFRKASLPKTSQARYILESIETWLRKQGEMDDVAIVSKVNHVEHIYPQKPENSLKLPSHNELVNRVGNLTLLHGRKNIQASNKPYPEKLSKYTTSSLLLVSATNIDKLWNANSATWRAEGIAERQKFLAGIAVRVWPAGAVTT